MDKPQPRPGDYLLNKYFPDADEETRERAREAFRQHALLLYRIGCKIAARQGQDSPKDGGGVIL